jgi:hypothetical protein
LSILFEPDSRLIQLGEFNGGFLVCLCRTSDFCPSAQFYGRSNQSLLGLESRNILINQ